MQRQKQRTATTTTRRAAKNAAPPVQGTRPPFTPTERAELWQLIVDCLYRSPRPPLGWSRARDGSILKQLARHYAASEIAAAIQGVPLLVKDVSWLGAGPWTLRVLYKSASGVTQMFGLATAAYHRSQASKPAPVPRGTTRPPVSLADLVAQITHTNGDRA